jgi:glucose-6-phosphate isomerase
MKLNIARTLNDLRPVLLDPNCFGPETVYWVFGKATLDVTWENMTVIVPGLLGKELTKTFGHYHGTNIDEIYAEVSGEGILLLQKKIVKGGVFVPNEVSEVLLVKVSHGEKVIIRPEYGHSWSNLGAQPFITYDNWQAGHSPSDYDVVKELHGMAYYLTRDGGEVVPVPNPSYRNLPQPVFLSADELNRRS